MSLTSQMISSALASCRDALPCATITIRYEDREYRGIRTTLENNESVNSLGAIEGATGAIRLIVSELAKSHPKANDTIQVREDNLMEWENRTVLVMRYDQARATVRLDYGAEYA